MADFRHPNITAPTADGQLRQIRDYLYQLTNQLNYAVKTVDNEERIQNLKSSVANSSAGVGEGASDEEKAEDLFYLLKNQIIKSGDIIHAYYDVITDMLEGDYTALSRTSAGYDAFVESTKQWRESTPVSNTDYFKATKEIFKILGHNIEEDENGKPLIREGLILASPEIRTDEFYIKTGWLDDNHEIGGIELGQVSLDGNDTTYAGFAHFTTKELAFFDHTGLKVAVLASNLLEITNIKLGREIDDDIVGGSIETADYIIDTSDGIAFLYGGE